MCTDFLCCIYLKEARSLTCRTAGLIHFLKFLLFIISERQYEQKVFKNNEDKEKLNNEAGEEGGEGVLRAFLKSPEQVTKDPGLLPGQFFLS